MPTDRRPQPEQMLAFYRQLLERVQSLPGITSASVSTGIPVNGTNFGMPFDIVGKEVADRSQRPGAGFNMVTPELLLNVRHPHFTRTRIHGSGYGRRHARGDRQLRAGEEIFVQRRSAHAARLGGAIDSRRRQSWASRSHGKSSASTTTSATADPRATASRKSMCLSRKARGPACQMAVRTIGDPASMTKSIAAVINSLDPDLPMTDVKTMDQLLDESMGGDHFGAVLFGTFAVIALLLAAFGIYGVMSFGVAQRTHEIGLAHGTGRRFSQVLGMILKEGMTLGAIGLVIGLAGAYGVGKLMRNLLFGIGTIDYGAFSAVAAILLLSALLACYMPARRATRVDPMAALRQD